MKRQASDLRDALILVLTCAAIGLNAPPARGSQTLITDRIGEAKALYESAEYDGALTVLRAMHSGDVGEPIRDRAVYEALCLLALDRQAEAEAAVAQIL